jgi:hypothetical protein
MVVLSTFVEEQMGGQQEIGKGQQRTDGKEREQQAPA